MFYTYYWRTVLVGIAVITVTGIAFADRATAEPKSINGIYILNAPADYDEFQLLVKKYKDSGADSIIIRPVTKKGGIDKQSIAKAVFFAHACGLKLFVILPVRTMKQPLEENPDWEDMSYDPWTRSIKRNGKLDLFNASVSEYLLGIFKDVAGYSIDGIILDDDFYYGDTEGLTSVALERYKLKYGSFFSSREAFVQLKAGERASTDLYGNGFWSLADLKKNLLLSIIESIIRETHPINKDLKFGVSLHVPGLFLKEKEMLAWYSHDIEELSRVNAYFFWLAIPHRDMRQQQDMNYQETIEAVSRTATSTGMLVKDENVMIAIQAASHSGKSLPLSEIEEVSMQVKKAGNTGIAFMVTPDMELPSVLTRKIFKGQM